MRMGTVLKRTAVVAVSTAALAAGVTGTAYAGSNYDGQDPISSGCANDAYTAHSAGLYWNNGQIGTVQLRYSPSCRTTWARVYSNGSDLFAAVFRNGGQTTYQCTSPSWDSGAGQYYCYTAMVNDAGYTSFAQGMAHDSANYANDIRVTASY